MSEIKNRIDFIYIFDVQDGNPNGDPDAGNLPRVDAETGMGLVTDVCLKRKVRNYIQIAKQTDKGYDIYIKEKSVLGRSHIKAANALGYSLGEEAKAKMSNDIAPVLSEISLPDGLSIESDEEDNNILVVSSDADKDTIKTWLKESGLNRMIVTFINKVLKDAKPKQTTESEKEGGREWMCKTFFDIRSFGAVLSLKSAPNFGQVRGPIQFTFARSVDPIAAAEHSITRMAVATEKEAKKQSGDNRTMGRKSTVPYGLYICHGFISANLAQQTGFSEEDLALFWEALKNMFDVDRSAARGLMSAQKLIVFKHDSILGNAPANKLFDLVKVEKVCDGAPRSFRDYEVTIDTEHVPSNITVEELI
ncbi:MAG: type I-C CRISPR-associated protein Cas7/Csd2 [Prevotellaceae bacterium]|nr:type I-C CRISPR-associated protein Cas7/Csd2 [Prevotellaceae bacterium]